MSTAACALDDGSPRRDLTPRALVSASVGMSDYVRASAGEGRQRLHVHAVRVGAASATTTGASCSCSTSRDAGSCPAAPSIPESDRPAAMQRECLEEAGITVEPIAYRRRLRRAGVPHHLLERRRGRLGRHGVRGADRRRRAVTERRRDAGRRLVHARAARRARARAVDARDARVPARGRRVSALDAT